MRLPPRFHRRIPTSISAIESLADFGRSVLLFTRSMVFLCSSHFDSKSLALFILACSLQVPLLAQSAAIAMKQGCWLGLALACPGDNAKESPICKYCWATCTPDKLEALKKEYNEITDQPYCRMYGCWQYVRVKNIAEGICIHQINEGKCRDPYYAQSSEKPKQFRRAVSQYQVRERPMFPRSLASPMTPRRRSRSRTPSCLLYTSDAADE